MSTRKARMINAVRYGMGHDNGMCIECTIGCVQESMYDHAEYYRSRQSFLSSDCANVLKSTLLGRLSELRLSLLEAIEEN